MGRGYLNLSGTGMRFNFSSLLDMSRVTSKYLGVGYGDGEGKTHPHPSQLSSLSMITPLTIINNDVLVNDTYFATKINIINHFLNNSVKLKCDT
jgi:hypothetical protein